MWPIAVTLVALFAVATWLTVFTKHSSSLRRVRPKKFRGKSESQSSVIVIDNRQILYPLALTNVVLDQFITIPTNTPQTFTAPSGANFISVYINGGGGGGSNNNSGDGGVGGAGAGIATVINHTITPGTVYTGFIDGSTGLVN